MGIKKTRLMRGDRYGLLKAAELAAEMIGDYERSRDGAREIRVESLEDAVWDDIFVERSQRTDKWQVKRLTAEFPADDASSVIVTASMPPVPGSLRPVSLHLGVARSVPVTKGRKTICDLNALADLCDESRKPGLVPDDFARTVRKSPAYAYVESCLPSRSVGEVVATLQRLQVDEIGTEVTLLARAAAHLQELFTNSEEIVRRLHERFIQYPDGTIAVGINLLYEQVIDPWGKRDPTRAPWIHLTRHAVTSDWEARGPLAVDELVQRAWSSTANSRVQLASPPLVGDAASASVSRLLLHQPSRAAIEATHVAEWRGHVPSICGGTLGTSARTPTLNLALLTEAVAHHPARDQKTEREFALALSNRMDATCWDSYVSAVSRRLHEDEIALDLRGAMQPLWTAWNAQLGHAPARAKFLQSMLATVEEWGRRGFERSARAGPLLIDDLARATLIALAIASTLSSPKVSVLLHLGDSEQNLSLGAVPVHVIALNAASHPDDRRPWTLSDAPGPFLSGEPGIAILGVIEASERDLYAVALESSVPFHASEAAAQNYRHIGPPRPVLTASPVLRAAMRTSISAVRTHVTEALARMNDARIQGLRQAVHGAPENV